jgi:hypothetical protein
MHQEKPGDMRSSILLFCIDWPKSPLNALIVRLADIWKSVRYTSQTYWVSACAKARRIIF